MIDWSIAWFVSLLAGSLCKWPVGWIGWGESLAGRSLVGSMMIGWFGGKAGLFVCTLTGCLLVRWFDLWSVDCWYCTLDGRVSCGVGWVC